MYYIIFTNSLFPLVMLQKVTINLHVINMYILLIILVLSFVTNVTHIFAPIFNTLEV